ncbi:hypothetical protein K3495_g12529 [Podosphaera aphanis]|nr:hypothetical protein K3495_g12529 [Podosphaera aphanis]
MKVEVPPDSESESSAAVQIGTPSEEKFLSACGLSEGESSSSPTYKHCPQQSPQGFNLAATDSDMADQNMGGVSLFHLLPNQGISDPRMLRDANFGK